MLTNYLGEDRTSRLITESLNIVSRVDEAVGLGLIVFRIRSRLLKTWQALNKSVMINSGITFDNHASNIMGSFIDTIYNKIETTTLLLRLFLQHHPVSRDLLTSLGLINTQTNSKSNSRVGKDSAQTEGVPSNGTVNEELLQAVILQAILLVCTVLFLIIMRFRMARRRQHRAIVANQDIQGGEFIR